jgi:hypothetical protein
MFLIPRWKTTEKPIISQLLNEFPAFTETEISLSCTQGHVTGPYPEPDVYGPHPLTLFEIRFNIILPYMYKGSCLQVFQLKFYMHVRSLYCSAHLIPFDFTILVLITFVISTIYEVPQRLFFCNLLFLPVSLSQTFSLAFCSATVSIRDLFCA